METLTPRGDAALDVRAVLRAALSNGHAPDLAAAAARPRVRSWPRRSPS